MRSWFLSSSCGVVPSLMMMVLPLILSGVSSSPFYRQSTSSPASLFGVPRGGGLFGKDDKSATADVAATTGRTTYPAMTQEEVEEWLVHIPVFAVTDTSGNGIVLKPDGEDNSGVFYFFMSSQMANATLTQLKSASGTADLDLRVSAFSLGKVWFKVLKNVRASAVKLKEATTNTSDEAEVVTNDVEYRLVPDTRDLLGARMLLTMDPADSEELKNGGTLTPEKAQSAIKKAMSESPKFNSTYNEIPVFMIQQMRMQKPVEKTDGDDNDDGENNVTILPMYFNLQNMVSLWQQFTAQSEEAKGVEPAINLMDLGEMVDQMQKESEIDFRSIVLMPSTPPGTTKAVDGASANGQAVEPSSMSTLSPDDMMKQMSGETTLGDL